MAKIEKMWPKHDKNQTNSSKTETENIGKLFRTTNLEGLGELFFQ